MNYLGAEPRGITAAKTDLPRPYLRLATPRQSLGEFLRLKLDWFYSMRNSKLKNIVTKIAEIQVEEKPAESKVIKVDGDYEINEKGRLALMNPPCPEHGSKYVTMNGYTSSTVESITGEKIKIILRMHVCSKCGTILMPDLSEIKRPYNPVAKQGRRFAVELMVEDGSSNRKAANRIQRTFGLDVNHTRLWYWIQKIGRFAKEKNSELMQDIVLSGVFNYDEKILLKIHKNVYRLTLRDANTGVVVDEDVRDNKRNETIKEFLETLKGKKMMRFGIIETITKDSEMKMVTDLDEDYLTILKEIYPNSKHQLCKGHLNEKIERDLRMSAGLGYKRKPELPADYKELKNSINWIFKAKTDAEADKRLYYVFEKYYGCMDKIVDDLLDYIKKHFRNLTYHIEDASIPMTNGGIESKYAEYEPNYLPMKRFKNIESARSYSLCQMLYRNFYKIKEGINEGTSPFTRAGLKGISDDWLEALGFGPPLYSILGQVIENPIFDNGWITKNTAQHMA